MPRSSPVTGPEPQRAEVWIAAVDKSRPVIILTRDPMGRYLNSVLAVPVSSCERGLAVEVVLDERDGLKRRSFANLDGAQRVDRGDLMEPVGRVRTEKMDEICRALNRSVDCI